MSSIIFIREFVNLWLLCSSQHAGGCRGGDEARDALEESSPAHDHHREPAVLVLQWDRRSDDGVSSHQYALSGQRSLRS